MKNVLLAVGLMMMAGSAVAAGKPCAQLQAEIDAKIKANGASGYSLEVVERGTNASGEVVGTCEGGTRQIVYRKG
jgi:hypothetical protein